MSESQLVALSIFVAVICLCVVVLSLFLMDTRDKLKEILKMYVENSVKTYQLKMTDDHVDELARRMDNTVRVLNLLITHLGLEYSSKQIDVFKKIEDKKVQ
jgi:short subunit fatty acids transporter